MAGKETVAKTVLSRDNYKAVSYSRQHEMAMDRPLEDGGDDDAATPVEYLLAAIGGCVSMTLRVYAVHKQWNLGEITVVVTQKKELTPKGVMTSLIEEISFENEITDGQRKKLLVMAGKCPVAQLVKKETIINSIIKS